MSICNVFGNSTKAIFISVKVWTHKYSRSTRLLFQIFHFFNYLSSREREVISLLCEGFTNQGIGDKLYISPETVKNHKVNIMEKLQLKTNNDLLLWVGEIRKEWRQHFGIK